MDKEFQTKYFMWVIGKYQPRFRLEELAFIAEYNTRRAQDERL